MNESIGLPTGGEGYLGEPPEFFNFAEDVVGTWARNDPKKIALIWIDDDGKQSTWTFQELDRASSRLAYILDQRGLKPGDRVIIQMRDDQPWWYITALAVMKTGGVFIIMSIGWTPSSRFSRQMVESDTSYAIRLTKPRVVISDMTNSGTIASEVERLIYDEAEFSSELEKAPAEFRSVRPKISEPCYARLTSGTTGSIPKMVLLSHASLFYRYYKDGVSKDDLNWVLVPARAPLWAGIWRAGMPMFLRSSASQSPATLIAETLCNYPITHLRAGSRVFDDLASIGFGDCTYKSLRKGMCVGSHANLKPDTRKAWIDKLGITITGGYGQSELGPGAFLRGKKSGSGSLGKPSPLYDISVIDEQGRELPPNELGQIAVRVIPKRPPGLFLGYLGDPDATKARFRGDWYLTGDAGTVDEDGYFWFACRMEDLLEINGVRISPTVLEHRLLEHPAVQDIAVIQTDAGDAAGVTAFVVLKENETMAIEPELKDLLQNNTNGLNGGCEIRFLPELPRAGSKLLRRELKAKVERAAEK